jgi:hypothetical protein
LEAQAVPLTVALNPLPELLLLLFEQLANATKKAEEIRDRAKARLQENFIDNWNFEVL